MLVARAWDSVLRSRHLYLHSSIVERKVLNNHQAVKSENGVTHCYLRLSAFKAITQAQQRPFETLQRIQLILFGYKLDSLVRLDGPEIHEAYEGITSLQLGQEGGKTLFNHIIGRKNYYFWV